MRRLTVLRLPFQLVFPGENVRDSDSFCTCLECFCYMTANTIYPIRCFPSQGAKASTVVAGIAANKLQCVSANLPMNTKLEL
jgi:hypothetical protein